MWHLLHSRSPSLLPLHARGWNTEVSFCHLVPFLPLPSVPMRLGVLQFHPVWGDPEASRARASRLLEEAHIPKDGTSFLVLPEMAFTGYMFENRAQVLPLAEEERGKTYQWCCTWAQRLDCFVACGYPRQADDGALYNSLCVVDPEGTLVTTYDKHFLFEADKTWATEGSHFSSFHVPQVGTVGVALCMDINPWEFKAPFAAFEYATFLKKQNPRLILFAAAWLDAGGEVSDLHHYWFTRLMPLWGTQCTVLAANRIGSEKETRFAGSSAILDLQHCREIVSLSKNEECVVFVEVNYD